MNHSEQIQAKIQLTSGPRISASRRLWDHPDLEKLIPWALIQGYIVSNASVPLMQAALDECERRTVAGDPIASAYGEYLSHHIPEEIGHDVQCLDDLEALGFDRIFVRTQLPGPSLVSLIGMQYYWINHRHPIAFTGYASSIEGSTVSPSKIRELQLKSGLPENGFRMLAWHSAHDPEHSGTLNKLIDKLPLTEAQQSLIGVNIANSNALIARALDELIATFESRSGKDH